MKGGYEHGYTGFPRQSSSQRLLMLILFDYGTPRGLMRALSEHTVIRPNPKDGTGSFAERGGRSRDKIFYFQPIKAFATGRILRAAKSPLSF
jgi:hypothetical protein